MNFQHPTAFDVWSGVASAALYLVIAIAALVRTRGSGGARTFFTIALASLAPYLMPAALGRIGYGTLLTVVAIATGVSLAVGSVALFHFTQVFPSRRPWIASRGIWLTAAYVVLPLGAIAGAWALEPVWRTLSDASAGTGAFDWLGIGHVLVLLVVLIPTIFVVGIVLPFTALLSLYKSWQEARRDGREGARVTTLAILISQLAGGVLTILVVPLLHLVAPAGPWVMIAAALLFGFGLLFPIAFAVGVWKYGLVGQT